MTASMQAAMPGLDSFLFGSYERDMDEAQAFEEAAEKAGEALFNHLIAIEREPQHVRDREYIALVTELFTGSNYGRNRLHWLLEQIAQDTDREPSELVIRWHGGGK